MNRVWQSDLIYESLARSAPSSQLWEQERTQSLQDWGFGGEKIGLLTGHFGLLWVWLPILGLGLPHPSFVTFVVRYPQDILQ